MSRASARIIGGQSVLDAEGREERRIAGMRQRNEQRRNRFLNAKVRVMGVDNLGIEQQKAEKLARKAAEKEADMTYSREQQMIRDLVEANLAKEQRDEYEGKRSIAEYNLQAQDKSMRREYDLNDPRGLQKERKTTCAALEATGSVGPSSMLHFAGEDRNYGDRQKMMQAQMRDWTSQQKAIKAQRREEEEEMDRRNAEMIAQIVDATGQIEAKEQSEKYEETLTFQEANKQLAMDVAYRKKCASQNEYAAKVRHVAHQRNTDWLTEHPRSGMREGGVRRDQWKGMNVQQLQSHYDMQYDQILEKQRRKQALAEEEADMAAQGRQIQDAMQQIVMKEQEEHEAMERDFRLAQAEQSARATERKRSDAIRDSVTAAVTDEFFNYFGASHR